MNWLQWSFDETGFQPHVCKTITPIKNNEVLLSFLINTFQPERKSYSLHCYCIWLDKIQQNLNPALKTDWELLQKLKDCAIKTISNLAWPATKHTDERWRDSSARRSHQSKTLDSQESRGATLLRTTSNAKTLKHFTNEILEAIFMLNSCLTRWIVSLRLQA